MKRLLLLIPFLLFFNSALVAQYLPDGGRLVSQQSWPGSGTIAAGPTLMLVDSMETNYNALVVRNDQLNIVKVYTASEVPAAFAGRAPQGLAVAETKDNTRLHRLDEIMELFEVPEEKRGLRVLLNKRLVDAALLLADPELIEKVEITKLDLVLNHVNWSLDPDEEYINISASSL